MIEVGWILATKDGKVAGNGIVTDVSVNAEGQPIICFETDIGKTGCMLMENVFKYWNIDIDNRVPVREWREIRLARILRTPERKYPDDKKYTKSSE